MRVLLLGSDSPLGRALNDFLAETGRHEVTGVSWSATRWKSERQAKKVVRRVKPELVVDLRMEAAADSGQEVGEFDIKRSHWVAKCCQRDNAAHLLMSSARVFSGRLDRMYNEADEPDSEEEVGQVLAAAEKTVQEACERHLILRLGPVFASDGANLITHMLGDMLSGEHLVLDNNLRGCPVSSNDGARVISAIIDQLSTGAQLWGCYHYCSSETTSYYEFAESVLASASQFSDFGPDAVELQKLAADTPSLNRSLECSKIRNTFAIKQLPWRNTIGDMVKQYYENQA